MIWYLLYPFRGTTEAPVLDQNHPLRSAFSRYGRYAASHVLSTLLVSVAVAAILIYPFPFLYTTDFTNGASSLPHHVWTDAHLLDEKATCEPDVIMRSIWIHGSYFQALDKDILLGALELQDELLGPTVNFSPQQRPGSLELPTEATKYITLKQRDSLHVVNGLTNESWFFHSPLQYWSCSSDRIEQDRDILTTVNQRKNQPTSVNVTLRHSIVFSGKRFEDRRLVAADALVITLIHRRDSPMGSLWQDRVQAIADSMADKWQVITPDDRKQSQLYEFQFRLMSRVDAILLGSAYSLVLLYFLFSLSKLRAVKSKIGLMVTVVVQIALAIISSFTICAICKIDLSKIPRLGYPVVIFSMSLENIFRLINGVILTASEDNTSNRIGHAFGQTAPIALASVAQNLLILYGLSRVVSSGVSAFCTFAAIAIIFDFFYLSTFFLAVLSVDVRRTELSDTLAKASVRSHRAPQDKYPHQTWLDTMLQGKIAMSTRIAGTVVMVGFVLIAQWHFFENESVARIISRLIQAAPQRNEVHSTQSSLLVEVHQARSPTSWLRLQDHETAREVINVIKPAAHSYTARVFDPYIFVLKGSDRMLSAHEPLLSPAIYDFARHQLTPFLVTIILVAALVRLLMNYLLWDQLSETDDPNTPQDTLLSVKTLYGGHNLDVALLTASSAGHLVSVGLDRIVRVWNIKDGGYNYVLGAEKNSPQIPFPILAICIEDEFHWLALLTVDRVLLWNLADHQWGPPIKVEPYRHKPEVFFFGNDDCANIPPLILVRRDGVITELRPELGESSSYVIPQESVVASVDALAEKAFPPKIMTSTREGQVHLITQDGYDWVSSSINVSPRQFIKEREFISIQALPELSFFLIIRSQTVDLVDSQTQRAIYTFKVDPILPKSLKAFHSRPRRMRCGSVALWSFTIAYLNAYTRDLVVQTYSPQNEDESLCFCDPDSPSRKTCCPWRRAKETRRIIKNPGIWLALPSGIMVGVRRKISQNHCANMHSHSTPSSELSGLRNRRHAHRPAAPSQQTHDDWEAWMFSHFGGKQDTWETAPLCIDAEDDGHLFVTSLGPMANVGSSSVVVGLSNVIKVITVGQERFETEDVAGPGSGVPAVGSRRRKGPSSLRTRPPPPVRKCC
ncbi:putative srebp cleavage activating protein [Rosellinia necatrix]|uniref:Putative srebp cleavage activating protein n=1 Tax=Rosellinia necatrix TaxID=77044 RepID=A0A1W2TLE3_ROSNE|nr:putative srebp cleavage activating protein [Rosellinia necatrix]